MFQDRRKHPRYPVLIKARASVERERFEVACTDIGPASVYCSSRTSLKVGQRVVLELRSGGLGSPIVEVHGVVVRSVLAGGTWPSGFALAWILARCELGAEPLLRLLGQVLRLPGVTVDDTSVAGRIAEFDLEGWVQRGSRPAPSMATSANTTSTAVRRVQGSWSPPIVSPNARAEPEGARSLATAGTRGAGAPRGSNQAERASPGPEAPLRPTTDPHPVRPATGSQPPLTSLQAPLPRATAARPSTASQPAQPGPSPPQFAHAPQFAPTPRAVQAVQGPQPPATPGNRPLSAWRPPPFSARPGSVSAEPVPSTVPRVGDPVSRPGVFDAADRTPAQTIAPDLSALDSGAMSFAGSVGRASSPGQAPTADSRVMRPVEVPVTFVRRNQFVPGRLVGIAQLAVAVVTEDTPPELHEPLVINLPVAVDGVYRTIYLSGKPLQVATETDQGRRFVMHIEKVEEGKHKGVFKQMLAAAAAQ